MERKQVIIKPIYSEKSLNLGTKGCYTFVVASGANKLEIKKALKDVLGVDAQKITTVTVKGELRRVGKRRTKVRESTYKKAIVSLKKGQKLNIYDFEEEKKDK